jgi:NADPH2:quinone reductase
MKALLSRFCGGPETLVTADVPEPLPADGQVRIAVRACGINYPDVLMIEDRYQFRPERPFSPGVEISGVIDSVAEDVAGFEPGQRVMASVPWGGLAESVCAAAARCIAIPDDLPFDMAAAFQVTYGTAYHALVDRGALKSGETLLVLGASGGVGLAAVELGRALGARVLAAVSSVEKAEVALRHGAIDALVYPESPDNPKELAAKFKVLCSGAADVIYDPIGGGYAEPALRSISWGGRYLVIGFAAGIPSVPLNLALLKGCSIVGVFWGSWVDRCPDAHHRNTQDLISLIQRGLIRPWVSEHFPLDRGGEAIRQLADRRARGKLVVLI